MSYKINFGEETRLQCERPYLFYRHMRLQNLNYFENRHLQGWLQKSKAQA